MGLTLQLPARLSVRALEVVEVIPAIDLRGGRCVRLFQGDYAQETVFSHDPAEVARRWESAGAPRIHVVDLDGARTGQQANREAIASILAAVSIPLQVGGGVRTIDDAEGLAFLGVDRFVLGTAAVRDPDLVARVCQQFGGRRIVVAVDARNGQVAIEGWREDTSVTASDLVSDMTALGVPRFLYTDISRDGTLSQPNFDALAQLGNSTASAILASGGVSQLEHLTRLSELGAEGAILGRALYTGDIDLARAIQATR